MTEPLRVYHSAAGRAGAMVSRSAVAWGRTATAWGKTLSWTRRELAKRDPEAVRELPDEHRGTPVARVVREVTDQLTTSLKDPRRPGP